MVSKYLTPLQKRAQEYLQACKPNISNSQQGKIHSICHLILKNYQACKEANSTHNRRKTNTSKLIENDMDDRLYKQGH